MSKIINITNRWILFTWVSFVVTIITMIFVVIYMPIDNWLKDYLGLSNLFLVQPSIFLSKMLHDQTEYQSE